MSILFTFLKFVSMFCCFYQTGNLTSGQLTTTAATRGTTTTTVTSTTPTIIDKQNGSTTNKPQNIKKLDVSIDPDQKEERDNQTKEAIKTYDQRFGSLDMEKSYLPLFELLWYAQMPCVDVKGITSEKKDELSFIKRCYWKNKPISCNSIFQKRPTDRGMCCSFNMEKAEQILKGSKYTNAISLRQEEEGKNGFEKDEKPQWYVNNSEPKPEAGRNKGLTLVVDRHSDKLSPSTVTDNFLGFVFIASFV